MTKHKCRICKSPATRVTYFFQIGNSRALSFWSRLWRKARGGLFHKEAVCERCYLVCEQGIETATCDNCGFNNLIDLDYLYGENETLYCCGCGKPLKFDD